jgi:hypothetical protein
MGEVASVTLADTNNDTVKEIVAGTGAHVRIFALNVTTQRFTQAWTSQDLPATVTDIAVGDTNDNGLAEILATGTRGNVYSFEYTNPQPPLNSEAETNPQPSAGEATESAGELSMMAGGAENVNLDQSHALSALQEIALASLLAATVFAYFHRIEKGRSARQLPSRRRERPT